MKLEMRQEAWLATDLVTDLTDGWPQQGVRFVVIALAIHPSKSLKRLLQASIPNLFA